MASRTIPIMRYDYGSSEFNGYPPNVITAAASAVAIASADTITIDEADFKDHKTLFCFENKNASGVSVTFKHGDTYQGVKDVSVTVPSGVSHIWLDSARLVNKKTGKITVTTTASQSLTVYGVEMR